MANANNSFVSNCWMFVEMADFVKDMPREQQISLGFWGVEPSTKMARIEWSPEGCQRLHGHLPSHGCLPQDPHTVFEDNCYKLVTIADLISEMSDEERAANPWTADAGDITMAKLTWSKRACEIMHPDLWKHPAPYILDGCIQIKGEPFSLAEWGNDFSIIDISDNTGPTRRVSVGEESRQKTGPGEKSLEDLESDSDSEESDYDWDEADMETVP